MKEYDVRWEITLYAESPREAAEQAFETITEPGSTATIFAVRDARDANPVHTWELIDLDEPVHEEDGE